MDLDSIWTETLLILRRQTTQATYDAILKDTRLVSLVDDCATISAETEQAKGWLGERLRPTIARALSNNLDREIDPDQLAFVVGYQATDDEERPFYVRDMRINWYSINNEFIDDGYAAYVGPVAIAVYNVLCCRANNSTQQCWPGKGYIAKCIGVSDTKTVRKAIMILEELNIIRRTPRYEEKTKTHSSDLYDLLDISEWETITGLKE